MKIKIYQINMGRDDNRVAFVKYEHISRFTGTQDIDSSIYDCVFDSDVNCNNLEDVYNMFNLDQPEDYTGRSMSVSDVVEVVESESVDLGFYYCDSVGFKKIDFEPEKAKTLKEKRTITVVLLEPGKLARVTEIGTRLEDLQKVVGGDIETFYPYEEPVCLVCDDEGKIAGKELNRAIYDGNGQMMDIMAGTFFICDCRGESFGSLNKEQQEEFKKRFLYPEHFVRINDEIKAIKFNPEISREDR